jgi:hypothetical protein
MQLAKLFNALALGGALAQARAIAPSIGEMIAGTVRGKPTWGVHVAPVS